MNDSTHNAEVIADYTGEVHPAADLFPMQDATTFAALVESIRLEGFDPHEAVVLMPDGMLLDGRNRLRAAITAGVEPVFRTYFGDDPVGFVLRRNSTTRRHLSESQRGMIAANAANLTHGQTAAKSGKFATLPPVTQSEAAKAANVSKRSVTDAGAVLDHGAPSLVEAVEQGKVAVSTAATIARDMPAQEQSDLIDAGDEKAIIAKAKEIKNRKRQERLAERAKRDAELSEQVIDLTGLDKFQILYVDPPWRYDHSATSAREIENHYPTMSHEEICDLQVPADDDAVLFMWVTNPKLDEGLEVLRAWGFDYRTNMVWVKDKIGMGYYARSRHELLLIARKGSGPIPDDDRRPDSVVTATRGKHSAKPDEVYDLIEAMYPHMPKVELFARRPREGWAAWGNQA
jgi:N6-adenosine-specific RNA methylase IME4